jgi:5,5'-dehydrodivanillate O-demethylase
MGALLRRYWWPVEFSQSITTKPVPVRLLGEDLILFRDGQGKLGLLDRRCPHRGASLELGRVESDGLRCCYHGWKFAVDGRCLDMPAEPADTPLLNEVRQTAYRAQDMGGLVFAYLGPAPAPLLPRYDVMVRDDCSRVLRAGIDHCNWLQRIENGHDPAHLGILHAAGYPQIAMKTPKVTRERTWYGFRTTTQFPNDLGKVSHQIFPSHTRRTGARVGEPPRHYIHYRVPMDDTHTVTYSIQVEIVAKGQGEEIFRGWKTTERGVYGHVDDGWWNLASNDQDRAAQESQGVIHDRCREFLGTSDMHIVQLRRLFHEQMKLVEAGQDPIGTIRDPAENQNLSFDATMNFADGTNSAPEMISARI